MLLQQVPAVPAAPVTRAPVEAVAVWEASDAADPVTRAAGRLYEATLPADERIPWAWIERSLRPRGRGNPPNGWRKHLLLAAPKGRESDPDALAGYVYGALLPGYGGYLCYVGVAERARRLGVGRRLYEEFFRAMRADADELDEPPPFVIWESHRPGPGAPPHERDVWNARTRLFDRVGGLWVDGIDFLSPNFDDHDGPPVPLQLFLKPLDVPASEFTPERLRAVVGGLHERVYRNAPGSPLYAGTLPPGCEPRLRPARDA